MSATRIAIENAEKVLMLVTDPASELWIRKLNLNVESLFAMLKVDLGLRLTKRWLNVYSKMSKMASKCV